MSLVTSPADRSVSRVSPEAAVRDIEERLARTRSRVIRQRVGRGACHLAVAILLALGLIAALDYKFELPAAWRALCLAVVIGGSLAGIAIGWRRLVGSYTLPEAAKDAERRASAFGQRLRTTLDYEYAVESPRPAQASRGLLDALHAETHAVAGRTDWDALVDGRPVVRAVALAAGCIGCWIIALAAIPEFRLAAARAILVPVEYTTVTFAPQSSTVKLGESVTIQAEVTGRPIAVATLRHRTAGSQDAWQVIPLAAEEPIEVNGQIRLHGALTATLANLQQDQEFEVLAGPRQLVPGAIRVLQPLKLESTSARIVPPAYTGRKEETASKLDLKVLEGSNIEWTLTLNRPAGEGAISESASGMRKHPADVAAAISPSADASRLPKVLCEGSTLKIALADVRNSGSYTVSAKAADGMLLEPVRLSVKVQLDRPPSVQFLSPPEDLTVTPLAEVPMIVEAADDLGLVKAGIMYQIGSGPPETLWEMDASGVSEPVRSDAVLMLEKQTLTFQDAITYYAFAEDNYFGQPRRTTTPLRFIDIRPFKQAFVLCEGSCSCQGQSVTLEELIHRQRQQLSAAFAAQQQPASPPADVLKRLAEGEADLLAKAEEFWLGMQELAGPIPALEEAVGFMNVAVTALHKEELAEGVAAEELALAALVRARENLKKKLSQSNSASQCQKFDRQQQQKLRKPEKKEQDKQQQVAEARKKLSELAQRERQWSQQAQQACQNPSGRAGGRAPQSGRPPMTAQGLESDREADASRSPNTKQNEPSPDTNSGEQSSPDAPAPDVPSPEALADAQKKMIDELAALQKQLADIGQASQAAQDQAAQASQGMQEGLEELEQQRGDAAAQAGERSAEALEKLADHLAAMNAKDIGQRLAQAQRLAQELAARQKDVEQELNQPDADREPGDSNELAGEERHLAAQARLLAEQLAALERDAASEPGAVSQKLAQAAAENPPADIADAIDQAAEDLKDGNTPAAQSGIHQTREALEALSQELGAARGQYAQPQLEELQKLEEQLAQLTDRLQRAKESGQKPSAADEARWQELTARLEEFAAGDKRLADALQQMRAAAEHRAGGQPLPPGIYPEMELVDAPNVREIAKALQAKIQEAILASSLLDADQPVPPQYKELVEKYYRALSDDLR